MECPRCGSKILNDSHFCRVCGSGVSTPQGVTDQRQGKTTPSHAELTPGSVFEGRYTILDELGRGGMGVVYKAEDSKLRRNVALKFLPPDLIRNRQAKERFMHEAQAASALDHPNICTVYEIDETDDGRMYISMGCYDGETLDKMIERGPLGVEEATSIAVQSAQGLAEAHEKGIVHRDVKPSNIIVTPRGQAKIMDFGLAKLTGKTRLTKAGTTMGTVSYMSPEQAQGEDVDHRTDVWSLGAVLYEMVTGREPFPGDYDQAVIYSILNEEVKPASDTAVDVSPELDGIINKCLKKDPEERYKTALELEKDLRRFRKSSGLDHVALYGKAPEDRKSGRRDLRRIVLWGAIAVTAVLALLVVPASRNALESLLRGESGITEKRVAVLPCNLVGGTPEDRAFCDGMTGVLTRKLAKLGALSSYLWVIPSNEIQDLETKSPTEAYKQLGANVALTGNMRLSNGDIMLVLIRNDLSTDSERDSDVQTVEERRSDPITEPFANLATWQDSVIVRMSRLLDLEITPEQGQVLFAGGTTVPRAYELFLKGEGYLYPYEDEQDIDKGISMFEEALREDSSYAEAFVELGRAYMWKIYYTKDERWLAPAVQACDHALAVDDQSVDAYVVAGYAHHYAGNSDEALKWFGRALEMDSLTCKAYAGMGDVFKGLGDLQQSEAAYRKATELQPRGYFYYYDLGLIYLAQQKYDEAIGAFEVMTELRPNDHKAHTNLGAMYFFRERLPKAREMFEKSLAIRPTYTAMQNLAGVYYWEARYADAARMYEQALALNPSDYRVWGHLADSYHWSPGNRDEAEENFRKAIELAGTQLEQDPDNAELLSNLASYHAMLGNETEAEEFLGRAIAEGPTQADEMLHIAETYEKLGQRAQALDWVEKSLDSGATTFKIERYPGLRSLRADQRFRQMRERSKTESTTMSSRKSTYGRG